MGGVGLGGSGSGRELGRKKGGKKKKKREGGFTMFRSL